MPAVPDRARSFLVSVVLALLVGACLAPANLPGPTASPPPASPPGSPRVVAQFDATEPIPSRSPAGPDLHVDGLARVTASDGLTARASPRRDGKKIRVVANGEVVFLERQKRTADGASWWRIPFEPYSAELGWIPERDGRSTTLQPVVPACPDPTFRLTTAELPDEGIVRLACFGSRPLELIGDLRCEGGIAELSIQGAPWTDERRWCVLDERIRVAGEPVTSLIGGGLSDPGREIGVVVIHGRFDAPGAEHCISTSFGVSLGPQAGPGEPGAILVCRQDFVATEVFRP
jgi:hypothetical protein